MHNTHVAMRVMWDISACSSRFWGIRGLMGEGSVMIGVHGWIWEFATLPPQRMGILVSYSKAFFFWRFKVCRRKS